MSDNINLDEKIMSTKNFFMQSLGEWESHRTYMYANGKVISSVTKFLWERGDDTNSLFVVGWNNEIQKSTGQMCIKIANDFTLERSIGYFSKSPTVSQILTCSKDCLHTLTTYGGATYDEKIEFVTRDLRIRRTIGYKEGEPEKVILIGTYVEKRIKNGDSSNDGQSNAPEHLEAST